MKRHRWKLVSTENGPGPLGPLKSSLWECRRCKLKFVTYDNRRPRYASRYFDGKPVADCNELMVSNVMDD